MIILRALIFNLYYYGLTATLCFAYIPLLLLPRVLFVKMVRFWLQTVYFGEKYILGLTYEIRGENNIPKDGPFLVAAKHQSAYETLKLHLIFNDPAIILKKELLSIPLWGWYARKAEMIAIDRSTPKTALNSIIEGAKRVKAQNRPIVIFPQGTRVHTTDTAKEKPYKSGIGKMYEATNMPILPLALNSGLFWPRNAFFKKPGKVIMEFLPLIPAGQTSKDVMKELEHQLEEHSNNLVQEIKKNNSSKKANKRIGLKRILITLPILFLLLFLAYTGVWFTIKSVIEKEIDQTYANAMKQNYNFIGERPVVSGFPGKYMVTWNGTLYGPDELKIEIPAFKASGWPLPSQTLTIDFPKGLSIEQHGVEERIDDFFLAFIIPRKIPPDISEQAIQKWQQQEGEIKINTLNISKEMVRVSGHGLLSLDDHLQPTADMSYDIYGFEILLSELKAQNSLSDLQLMLAYQLTEALAKTNPETSERFVRVPVRIQNRRIYLGPVLVGHLSAIHWPNDNLPAAHQQ